MTANAIAAKVNVPLPIDVVVAEVKGPIDDFMAFVNGADAIVKSVENVGDNDMILDVGPKTAAQFAEMLKASKTILWNGPVGVFEVDKFGHGTEVLSKAIADSSAFSIAGGGDTLAAIDKYGVAVPSLSLLKVKNSRQLWHWKTQQPSTNSQSIL